MKKIYILNNAWNKKLFINFNNLKKYLKEEIFIKMELSKKDIITEISKITLIKFESWDFRQLKYSFKDINIYSLNEYWEII